jgi:class 3 adenylate cyclase/PAS domain-containing protein
MTDTSEPEKDQIDEQALATKQALKYAQDLARTYGELKESENRYRALFEYAPISLWEEDLSQVKKYIDGLRDTGVKDFREYFDAHPEEVIVCTNLLRIVDANKSTLELYEADSKEELFSRIKQILIKEGQKSFREELIALCEGRNFELEDIHRTLKGKQIEVLIKAIIPPECEETWSKVLVSIHDLTERVRADFLKKMFGRYLSEEVMNTLIENPESVKLGGEKRSITIMITDLRGFTALSERLDPEQVVRMLNSYFEVMLDVVHQYRGTLNEIVGDSMLIIFGAPQEMADRAQQAIACAIEMQNAMAKVNNNNRSQGLPEIEMGIGINDAEVIIGNIGSRKRSKYGVVGSGVNITSRIESYSVGGQILISESMHKKTGDILRIDDQMEIRAKGSEAPLTLYEVGGISGKYNLALDRESMSLLALVREIPVRYSVLDGSKYVGKGEQQGNILRLSPRSAEIRLKTALEPLTNLKLNLSDVTDVLSQKDFFGKIIKDSSGNKHSHILRFTSVPPEISAYFQAVCWYGAKVDDPKSGSSIKLPETV